MHEQVRFWDDVCVMPRLLKLVFPALYNIVRSKGVSVRMVLSTIPLNVAFQRSLVGVNLHSWHEVVVRASPADYLNPLPILYLGSREQKNTLQQTIYLSTYFCWSNKFPLPLPRFVGPTNMPTYSLPRSSLSPALVRTQPRRTARRRRSSPPLLAALHPGGTPPAPLSSNTAPLDGA